MRPVSKMGFEVHIRNIPTATCMIISSLHLSLSLCLSPCLSLSLSPYLSSVCHMCTQIHTHGHLHTQNACTHVNTCAKEKSTPAQGAHSWSCPQLALLPQDHALSLRLAILHTRNLTHN